MNDTGKFFEYGESQQHQETQDIKAKRGGCLTAFLVLMIILNALSSVIYLLSGTILSDVLELSQGWLIPMMGILGVLNIVFASGILSWKRWGVYGLCTTGIIIFVLNLLSGISIVQSLLGFVGIIIMLILVRPIWSFLK